MLEEPFEATKEAPTEEVPTEETLLRAALSLTARLDTHETCEALLCVLDRIFDARSSWILLHEATRRQLVTYLYRGPNAEYYAGFRAPAAAGIVGLCFTERRPVFVPDARRETRWVDTDRMQRSGLSSVLVVPMIHDDSPIGVLGLESPRFTSENLPDPQDIERLEALAAHAVIGIRNARLFESVDQDRQRLHQLPRQPQLRPGVDRSGEAGNPSGVVGVSAALRSVLDQVVVVAPADSTVLIEGETGTGKELIARELHTRSRRAQHPFIAVNCAALPETLVESELFGHERGAFTGAVGRQPGKFELANGGTLFFDEIGDLPLQAQAKLLRVLQEREVQRIGATRPIPVNVRLIAATNQDLDACMSTGRFRSDLYYRLSVFPIRLAPLRERRDDIPVLAVHFMREFAGRLGKHLETIEPAAVERMIGYDWPGNVRELQNVIERAVILASGEAITHELIAGAVDAQPPRTPPAAEVRSISRCDGAAVISFSDAERGAIFRALNTTGWRISGRSGAAELLGLKPTTLHAKMKKLGIHRPVIDRAVAADRS